MNVQIYRVQDDNGSGFTHEELCINCAKDFLSKGRNLEFDGHLCKYVYEKDGITYYAEGGQDEGTDSEIDCSQCGEYFNTDEEMLDLSY